MLTKQDRSKMLEKIKDKDDKMLISKVIDKANKSELSDIMTYTNFLDLFELNSITPILNNLKISYRVLELNDNTEKKNIVFMPQNMQDNIDDIKNDILACIKIEPKSKDILKHKDYMGSIYSLGLKREVIGDIFVQNSCGYLICIKTAKEYILNNLFKVSNQNVMVKEVNILSEEVQTLDVEFKDIKIISPSMRADAILSEVYNLSRSEVKDKISRSDLYINSKNSFYGSELLEENDIVSFRKYGKIKIGPIIRTTKNDKIEISIKKYS